MTRNSVHAQITRLQAQIAALTEQLGHAERIADERRGAVWRRLMRRAGDPRVSSLLGALDALLDRPKDRAAFDLPARSDAPAVESTGKARGGQRALDLSAAG